MISPRFSFFLLFLILQVPLGAAAAPLKNHVNDPVNYLGAHRDSIERKLAALEQRTGYQVFVQTRPDTSYDTVEELGVKEFRRLNFGREGKDDGVLFLIIADYKNVHIETGTNVSGVIHNPAAVEAIQKALARPSDSDSGGAAAERGIDAVINLLEPGWLYSMTHPQSAWAAFLIIILNVGLVLAIAFGVQKYRSRRVLSS